MDKTTSVIAALKAGKQPSQLQTNAWIEKLLQSELIQVEKTAGAGELSQNGKKLARDLRDILEAYKGYVSHKNGMISPPPELARAFNPLLGENLVQNAIWNLSQADIAASSLDVAIPIDSKEASSDHRAIAASLRTSLQIFWESAAMEGFGVFSDLASFTRLSFADAAELVAEKSNKAAEKLRDVEGEVKSGKRDAVGIKEQTKEDLKRADTRELFEKSMDAVKDTGSAAIGVAQSAGHKTSDLADRSRTRVHAAVSTVSQRLTQKSHTSLTIDPFRDGETSKGRPGISSVS
jgi:hypothetical protein